MKHEFSLIGLENTRNPAITLVKYKELDKENPDNWEILTYDFTFPFIWSYKETKDSIEFTTNVFIDCSRASKIKIEYNPVYYARNDLRVGTLINYYKVKYEGMELKTGDDNLEPDRLVRITYIFKKIESCGSGWDFNYDDEVKEYLDNWRKTWDKWEKEKELDRLKAEIKEIEDSIK